MASPEKFLHKNICKLCVILRSWDLVAVCPYYDIGRRLPLELARIRVDRVMLNNLCTETIGPVFLTATKYDDD